MKKRTMAFLTLISVLTLALLLCGCEKKPVLPETVTEQDGTLYVCEKDGFGGPFTLTIREDGTFQYYEGYLSSYIGLGHWTREGDVLTLTDEGGGDTYAFVNRFREEDGALIWLEEGSTNFLYLKIEDGTAFRRQTPEWMENAPADT